MAREVHMGELLAVPVEGGGSLVVEVDAHEAGVVKAGRPGQVAGQAAKSLQEALAPLISGATAMLGKLREAKPSEVTLAFGVKLTAEAGAVITKTAGECNFTVTLHWRQAAPSDG